MLRTLPRTVTTLPYLWRLRNSLRPGFIWGWLTVKLARWFSHSTGIPTMTARLKLRLIRNGQVIDYGTVGYRVVTSAFVELLIDTMHSGGSLDTFAFHEIGEDNTAESSSDTALLAPTGMARVSGTQTEGASTNIYQTEATITSDGTYAVTEHGVFSAVSGGTLLDRTVFSPINVVSGDDLIPTYELTMPAGG